MEQLIYPILGTALFLGLTYGSSILVHGLPLVYYIAIGLAGICVFVFAVNTFLSRTYARQVIAQKQHVYYLLSSVVLQYLRQPESCKRSQ